MKHGITLCLLALVACGGTEPENDTLTLGEATAMLRGSWATVRAMSPPFGESSFPCPQGGEVRFTVTPSPILFTVDPRRCQLTEEGLTFILDGQPSVTMASELSTVDGRLREEGELDGTLAWELAGHASGSCSLDLTFLHHFATRDEEGQTTFEGMLCGHEVSGLDG